MAKKQMEHTGCYSQHKGKLNTHALFMSLGQATESHAEQDLSSLTVFSG